MQIVTTAAGTGGEERAGTVLTIDLAALAANYRLLRDRAAPAVCSAVVKADGYGLGAATVAPVFYGEGCRHFFVAHLDEALELKQALRPDVAIYILNGLPPGAEAECAAAGLIPVLNGMEQVARWAAEARRLRRPLPAVLQVDSGMSRLGLPAADVARIAGEPQLLDGIRLLYVMSHLACADQPDHPLNARQLEAFRAARAAFPGVPASLANSAGIFLGPDYHFDLVRPGASLYGLAPALDRPNPMERVVTLHAKVIQTREIAAGDVVGYGATFRAERPTRVATIALGYGDGWPRALSGRGAAWYEGTRLPFLGRVSMDSITIDVSALPPGLPQAGDLVELLGPHQSADEVAAQCGTIGYEILTSLGRRHHRRYIGG